LFEQLSKTDSALFYYKQVLTMPDSVDDAKYRHHAAVRLTDILITRKDYSAALYYLDLSRGRFFAIYGCGTNIEAIKKINDQYLICYIGVGNYKQAIDRFACYMFTNLFCDVQKLYEAYSNVYTKEEIKKAFLQAKENIEIKKEQRESGPHLLPVFKIFDKEIELFTDDGFEKLTEQEQKQQCMDEIRKSEFYKLAMQGF